MANNELKMIARPVWVIDETGNVLGGDTPIKVEVVGTVTTEAADDGARGLDLAWSLESLGPAPVVNVAPPVVHVQPPEVVIEREDPRLLWAWRAAVVLLLAAILLSLWIS